MADHHPAPDVDPKELERAQEMWHAFTESGKYSIIAIIITLIGLALAFVKFT